MGNNKLIRDSPKNETTKNPIIKNGANGIFAFILAFPITINSIPNIEPTMKETRNQIKESFGERADPIRRANLTSPNPIPFPFVARLTKSRNIELAVPIKRYKYRELLFDIRYQKIKIPNPNQTNSSGII